MVFHRTEAYIYNCYGSKSNLYNALSHQRKERWLRFRFAELFAAMGCHCLHNALSHQRKERWLRFRFAELFAAMGCHCLHNALSHHSLGNLHKASYVGTLYVVNVTVGLCTVLHAVLVDVLHDPEQLSVNFLS